MTGVSTVYRREDFRGDLVILELTVDDARDVFWGCRKDQNPVDFLKAQAKEVRSSRELFRKARWSFALFLIVLFFLRRFIP